MQLLLDVLKASLMAALVDVTCITLIFCHVLLISITLAKVLARSSKKVIRYFGGADADAQDKGTTRAEKKNKNLKAYLKRINIKQRLTAEEQENLQKDFPSLSIKFSGQYAEPHAYSHASRLLERRTILFALNINGTPGGHKLAREKGYTHEYIDVGGRIMHQLHDKISSAHVETPRMSSKDIARIASDKNCLSNYYRDLKLSKTPDEKYIATMVEKSLADYQNNGGDTWCFQRSQDCDKTAEKLVFLHSLYDMTSEDICDIFRKKKATEAMGTIYYDFDILNNQKKEGMIKFHNAIWKKQGNNIVFTFKGDQSTVYEHDLQTYLEKITTTRLVSKDKQIVVDVEHYNQLSGVLFLKYVLVDPASLQFEAGKRLLQKPENAQRIVLKNYVPMRDHLGAYNRKIQVKYLELPKEYFDKVYAEVLRCDNGRFTLTTAINLVTTFNNDIMVNGAEIVRKIEIPVVDNFELAHALFVMAFVKKMEMSNITALLTNRIKDIRATNSSILGVWYKLIDSLPFVTNKLQVYSDEMGMGGFAKFMMDLRTANMEAGTEFFTLESEKLVQSNNRDLRNNVAFKEHGKDDILDFTSSRTFIDNIKGNDDRTYTCGYKYESSVNVPGDGDCAFHTYKKLTNDPTTPAVLRKQVAQYAAFRGRKIHAEGQDYVSFYCVRTLADMKGYNLCMHADGERFYADNGHESTLHYNYLSAHFTPVTDLADEEVPIHNIVDEDNTIVAKNDMLRDFTAANFVMDDNNKGGALIIYCLMLYIAHYLGLTKKKAFYFAVVSHFVCDMLFYAEFKTLHTLLSLALATGFLYKLKRIDGVTQRGLVLRATLVVMIHLLLPDCAAPLTVFAVTYDSTVSGRSKNLDFSLMLVTLLVFYLRNVMINILVAFYHSDFFDFPDDESITLKFLYSRVQTGLDLVEEGYFSNTVHSVVSWRSFYGVVEYISNVPIRKFNPLYYFLMIFPVHKLASGIGLILTFFKYTFFTLIAVLCIWIASLLNEKVPEKPVENGLKVVRKYTIVKKVKNNIDYVINLAPLFVEPVEDSVSVLCTVERVSLTPEDTGTIERKALETPKITETPIAIANEELSTEPNDSFIVEIKGDIWNSKDLYFAHCISRDKKMSAGIATQFVDAYGRPKGNANVGKVILQETNDGCYVFHLVTKHKYNQKPRLDDLRYCLEDMLSEIYELEDVTGYRVDSVSMPRIGCGLDKLDWNDVRKQLVEVFAGEDIMIKVYDLEEGGEEPEEEQEDPQEDDTYPDPTLPTIEEEDEGEEEEKPEDAPEEQKETPTEKETETKTEQNTTLSLICRERLSKCLLTKREMESLVSRISNDRSVTIVKNHVHPTKTLYYMCSVCLDLQKCPLYKSAGYRKVPLTNLNEILLNEYDLDYPPFSNNNEYMRNACSERLFMGEMTIRCIREQHEAIAKMLKTNGALQNTKALNSMLSGLQKLKEYKKLRISVFNTATQCFTAGPPMFHDWFVTMEGKIVSVQWDYDNYTKKKKMNGQAGYVFTTSDLEIYNEPAIVSKLKQVLAIKTMPVCEVNMINGIAGCGKTTRICRDFKMDYSTVILSSTKDAAADVRNRLFQKFLATGQAADHIESFLNRFVRTIDSVLVNEEIGGFSVPNVMIDEALMRHPGEIYAIMMTMMPSHVGLIGDIAQIPYVNRLSNYDAQFRLFPFAITERMYLSYRCPIDVVATISKHYDGKVTSASSVQKSMKIVRFNNLSEIPKPAAKNTHVIVFKQSEKQEILKLWPDLRVKTAKELEEEIQAESKKSGVNSVHEYQGRQAKTILMIRTSDKPQEEIYKRPNYALVGITRHTHSFVYYTRGADDAVTDFINKVPKDLRPFMKRSAGGVPFVRRAKMVDSPVFLDITPEQLELYSETKPDYFLTLTDEQRVALSAEMGRGYQYVDIEVLDNARGIDTVLRNMNNIRTDEINVGECPDGAPIILQSEFDRILPKNAQRQNFDDQLLSERSDLTLTFDNLRAKTSKSQSDLFKNRCSVLTPVLTTSCPTKRVSTAQEIFLGIQKRNACVPEMQGLTLNKSLVTSLVNNFTNTYFDAKKNYLLAEFSKNVIGPTERNTQLWLDASKYTSSYLRNPAMVDVLQMPFNKYDYSIKEAPKPVQTYAASVQYQALQTISAHKKFVNAVFCPVIKEAKTRITTLLKSKYTIFTDMSNDDFVEKLNYVCNPAQTRKLLKAGLLYSKELDISKYDKSQGYEAIAFQCTILKMVGCTPEIIDYYQMCQKLSTLSNRKYGIHFYLNYQMKSGVALTLLGNTLFTMATNALLYPANKVYIAAFCGDDAYYLLHKYDDEILDKSSLLSNMLNLEVKEMSYYYPYFCSKFLLPGKKSWYLIPDPLKLLNKLGRKDVLDFEHAEEYRRSANDNFQLKTEEALHLLDQAVSERYKVRTSNINMILTLKRILREPQQFRQLFFESTNYIKPKGFVRYDLTKV